MGASQNEKYWAVILGASSGFGAATARHLAKDGFNIIGIHLDRQSTMPNVIKIKEDIEACGVEAVFYNHNAADAKYRKMILDDLENRSEEKPKVKVLMHSLAFGSLKKFIPQEGEPGITPAQMEMTLDVMAHSLVYWTQDLVLRGLLVPKSRVFAMTSSGGRTCMPFYGAVSAAKAALESHIRQLAVELGHMEIGVNSIMAGVTDTPALRKIPGSDKMIEVARRKSPRNRLTTPEDIAKIISFLTQDGGEWINGGIIAADGGEEISNYVGQNATGLDSI